MGRNDRSPLLIWMLVYIQVNLGVEKKSEQSHSDMVAMMDYYHSFVPYDDMSNPVTLPLAGKF